MRLRSLGRQLGEYTRRHTGSKPTPAALQGVVADLAAEMPDLQAPLRDLVSRQSFSAILDYALSGRGLIQRDSLIQEISRVYHPDVLADLEEILSGFLSASEEIPSSRSQNISTHLKSPNQLEIQEGKSVTKRDPPSRQCPIDHHSPPRLKTDQQPKESTQAQINRQTSASAASYSETIGYWPLATIAIFLLIVVSLASQFSNPQVSTPSDKSTDENQDPKLREEELSQRLANYQSDLNEARLICELDNVANRFKTLAADASRLNVLQLQWRADAGAKSALNRIAQIKQPGKTEYWEDCSVGVGFQFYDDYTWQYGSSYKGSIFAVAKKDCKTPALKVEMATDSEFNKKIFSEWITFKPSAVTGMAQTVPFVVSATSRLPDNSRVWHRLAGVSCNYSG